MKSCLKLWFYPKAVGAALTNNVIVPTQLKDFDSLSDILSQRVVGKIRHLNTLEINATSKCHTFLKVMRLDWMLAYSTQAKEWPINWAPDTIISALAEDGDEALSNTIGKELQLFHVPFEVVRITNKEYGVVFGEGVGIESPQERAAYLTRDMERLLQTVSCDLTHEEIIKEEVFSSLVNLNV